MIHRLIEEEEGQTLVEYGLLVSLIAIVCIAILAIMGRKIRDIFANLNRSVTSTS